MGDTVWMAYSVRRIPKKNSFYPLLKELFNFLFETEIISTVYLVEICMRIRNFNVYNQKQTEKKKKNGNLEHLINTFLYTFEERF